MCRYALTKSAADPAGPVSISGSCPNWKKAGAPNDLTAAAFASMLASYRPEAISAHRMTVRFRSVVFQLKKSVRVWSRDQVSVSLGHVSDHAYPCLSIAI